MEENKIKNQLKFYFDKTVTPVVFVPSCILTGLSLLQQSVPMITQVSRAVMRRRCEASFLPARAGEGSVWAAPGSSSNGIIRVRVECDSKEEVTGEHRRGRLSTGFDSSSQKVHEPVSRAEDVKVSGNRTRCQKRGCALNKEEKNLFFFMAAVCFKRGLQL